MQSQNPTMPVGTYEKAKNPYTNWFSRVASYIVDHVSWIALGIIEGIWRHGGTGRTIVITILYIVAFIIWGYNRWFLGGRTGQSWGKMLMGTRLLGLHTGQPVGALKAFFRDVLHILDWIWLPIPWGMAWPIWDSKRQTLFADKIVKSVVLPADSSFPSGPGGAPLPGYPNAGPTGSGPAGPGQTGSGPAGSGPAYPGTAPGTGNTPNYPSNPVDPNGPIDPGTPNR